MDPDMDVFERLVLSRGRSRLLALSSGPHAGCDAITGFTVHTLAEDRLRIEATLSQAHASLDGQLLRDVPVHPPPARLRR